MGLFFFSFVVVVPLFFFSPGHQEALVGLAIFKYVWGIPPPEESTVSLCQAFCFFVVALII